MIFEMRSPQDVSYYLDALISSLQPPATLEHLELKCKIASTWIPWFISEINVWTPFDHLVDLPTCSRLRRVDVVLIVVLFSQLAKAGVKI